MQKDSESPLLCRALPQMSQPVLAMQKATPIDRIIFEVTLCILFISIFAKSARGLSGQGKTYPFQIEMRALCAVKKCEIFMI